MIRALILSIEQLGDRRILAVLLKSLIVTLAVLAALGVALWFGAQQIVESLIPGNASVDYVAGPASAIAGFAAIVGAFSIGWILFRVVAIAVIGLFGDTIVIAVESKHYPEMLATARDVPFGQSLKMGLGSAGRALLVNLILIPAYLLLLITGIGTPILFFAANGWLLGRDLMDMVAARHLAGDDMKAWRGNTSLSRFTLGLIVTGLLSVPGVNLIAPVLGAAMATHLFHGRKA